MAFLNLGQRADPARQVLVREAGPDFPTESALPPALRDGDARASTRACGPPSAPVGWAIYHAGVITALDATMLCERVAGWVEAGI